MCRPAPAPVPATAPAPAPPRPARVTSGRFSNDWEQALQQLQQHLAPQAGATYAFAATAPTGSGRGFTSTAPPFGLAKWIHRRSSATWSEAPPSDTRSSGEAASLPLWLATTTTWAHDSRSSMPSGVGWRGSVPNAGVPHTHAMVPALSATGGDSRSSMPHCRYGPQHCAVAMDSLPLPLQPPSAPGSAAMQRLNPRGMSGHRFSMPSGCPGLLGSSPLSLSMQQPPGPYPPPATAYHLQQQNSDEPLPVVGPPSPGVGGRGGGVGGTPYDSAGAHSPSSSRSLAYALGCFANSQPGCSARSHPGCSHHQHGSPPRGVSEDAGRPIAAAAQAPAFLPHQQRHPHPHLASGSSWHAASAANASRPVTGDGRGRGDSDSAWTTWEAGTEALTRIQHQQQQPQQPHPGFASGAGAPASDTPTATSLNPNSGLSSNHSAALMPGKTLERNWASVSAAARSALGGGGPGSLGPVSEADADAAVSSATGTGGACDSCDVSAAQPGAAAACTVPQPAEGRPAWAVRVVDGQRLREPGAGGGGGAYEGDFECQSSSRGNGACRVTIGPAESLARRQRRRQAEASWADTTPGQDGGAAHRLRSRTSMSDDEPSGTASTGGDDDNRGGLACPLDVDGADVADAVAGLGAASDPQAQRRAGSWVHLQVRTRNAATLLLSTTDLSSAGALQLVPQQQGTPSSEDGPGGPGSGQQGRGSFGGSSGCGSGSLWGLQQPLVGWRRGVHGPAAGSGGDGNVGGLVSTLVCSLAQMPSLPGPGPQQQPQQQPQATGAVPWGGGAPAPPAVVLATASSSSSAANSGPQGWPFAFGYLA